MAIVEESEFKGNAMIVLKNDEEDKFPFQFGVKKAKLVVENIEAIKQFIAKHDKQVVLLGKLGRVCACTTRRGFGWFIFPPNEFSGEEPFLQ